MSSLQVVCYDHDYLWRGVVGGYESTSVTPRFHSAGEGSVTVAADHEMIDDLTAAGARLVWRYRPDGGDWHVILSGTVKPRSGSTGVLGTQTFTVVDDWTAVMQSITCWPKPSAGIGSQTDAYYKSSGPAETVVKDVISANVDRLGMSLSVPTSQGLGPNVSVQVRMDVPVDKLVPLMTGIRVRVLQVGTTRTLLVDEPATFPRTLTEASGVVQNCTWSVTPRTVDHVVVGAGGEGEARKFAEYVADDYESWADPQEVFRDARDIAADDPNVDALMQQRADETLADGAAKSSLSCDLAEGEVARWLVDFDLGDTLPIQPLHGPKISEPVSEVAVTDDADSGLQVVPHVGGWSDSTTDEQYRQLAQIGRAVRILQRS